MDKTMTITGALFQIELVQGKPGSISSSGDLAVLSIEDDGVYHEKCSFDADWLGDLEGVVKSMRQVRGYSRNKENPDDR